jgi:hypothetical protein
LEPARFPVVVAPSPPSPSCATNEKITSEYINGRRRR